VDEELVVRSPQNPRVQAAVALHVARRRRRDGLHLAEGRRVCAEAIACAEVVELFFTAANADLAATLDEGVRRTGVDERVMERLADAVTPQGLVAVVRTPDLARPLPADAPVLVLDRVADPGNVGTLVRTAAALGASVLCAGGADPFGPKAVRAAAGACYRTTVGRRADLAAVLSELRASGRSAFGLAADGERAVGELVGQLAGRDVALVVGAEPDGIGADGRSALDGMLRIPMANGVESLNVAAAGAIALHALLGG